jgi:phosphopantetheinyl transferase (holo-ACP synthase)
LLIRDICTPRELENLCGNKRVRFALSFSCKEAFFKALGMSWTNSNISWKDIELLFNGPGFENYRVELGNYAKEILEKNCARIQEAYFDYNEKFVRFAVILTKEYGIES